MLPLTVKPMLATLAEVASHRDDPARWSLEYKWDGYRGLAHWNQRSFHLVSRNGLELGERFPVVRGLAKQLSRPMVLDGEVVALDEEGVPQFGRLQQWRPGQPLVFHLFDILQLGATDLTTASYDERRGILEALQLAGEHWRTPQRLQVGAAAGLALARARHLEGLVAKRRDSRYQAGRRSPDWLKFKLVERQELVICGFTPGVEAGTIGSLLLGYRERGLWRFAGGLGTGFTLSERRTFHAALSRLATVASPFPATPAGRAAAVWVAPRVVVEVEHRGWTEQGLLRVPAYLGVRSDKAATEVVRERPRPARSAPRARGHARAHPRPTRSGLR